MPVVINEFEVVPESPQPQAAPPAAGTTPPPLRPPDVDAALAVIRAREARVRAH